jgi:hypothetical protein
MATAQAFCICENQVSADTILADDDLERALDRDQEVSVMHVFVDENSPADHIWSLSSQEKESLPEYLSSGQG